MFPQIEAVVPGTVDLRKVTRDPARLSSRFRALENCNLVVTTCKALGLSTTGIGGADIASGNRKLLLALVWQLMRMHLLRTLEALGGGARLKDEDVLAWANATASKAPPLHNGPAAVSSFRDPSLASGLWLLRLLSAVEPRAVNTHLVTAGTTPDERDQNAKLAPCITVPAKLLLSVAMPVTALAVARSAASNVHKKHPFCDSMVPTAHSPPPQCIP